MGVLYLVHVLLFSTLGHSSFAIILMGKRELVALPLTVLLMSCDSQYFVALIHGDGLVCCVIVVFPDHTHLVLDDD